MVLQLAALAVLEALTFNLAQCSLEFQMFNLALNPPFCQTDVAHSIFYFFSIFTNPCLVAKYKFPFASIVIVEI